MAGGRISGDHLCGEEPKRLELTDGSRLLLDGANGDGIPSEWRRIGTRRPDTLSVREAADLAGEEFVDYVAVRTRSEAHWLHAVGDWYHERARQLEDELAEL